MYQKFCYFFNSLIYVSNVEINWFNYIFNIEIKYNYIQVYIRIFQKNKIYFEWSFIYN